MTRGVEEGPREGDTHGMLGFIMSAPDRHRFGWVVPAVATVLANALVVGIVIALVWAL